MVIVDCKICNTKFYVKPSWLKIGYGIYCSARCQHLARRNGKFVECFTCKKEIYKSKEKLSRSKSGKYFCSKSCQTIWRNSEYVGSKHPNWKTGNSSYKSILDREGRKKICVLCETKDKRVLSVHHIDKNHLNNTVENLAWLCHNCHHLVHHDISEYRKFMLKIRN